jgi:xanthine dehydrogenase accessory factor
MTLNLAKNTPVFGEPAFSERVDEDHKAISSSIYTDDLRDKLFEFHDHGLNFALVTLVNVEGSSPRPIGSQMVISETEEFSGLLSGGCIEPAVLIEAKHCIRSGEWKLIRYGKNSDYMDLKLPCGSGIDILIVPIAKHSIACSIGGENWIEKLKQARYRRKSVTLRFDIRRQACDIELSASQSEHVVESSQHLSKTGHLSRAELASVYRFSKMYSPKHRLAIFGQGHIFDVFCLLAQNFDFELNALSKPYDLKRIESLGLDEFSSAVLLDHDHEHDIPLICELIKTPVSYIAALGSKKTHQNRLALLAMEGIMQNDLSRLKGPAGLDIGGKSPQEIALSILAEIVAFKNNKVL